MFRILTRFEIGFYQAPARFYITCETGFYQDLDDSWLKKISNFHDNFVTYHSTSLAFLESNLPGSYQDAIEILAGSCQDLNDRTEKECAHRVLISRPSVYELNSLPGWTVPCYQEWVHVWSSVFQAQKFSLVWIFRKTSNTQKAIQNWKGFLRDCNYLTTHVIRSSLPINF